MTGIKAVTISIGDELLSGKTVDSNNAYIAQQLDPIGIPVVKKLIIGDDKQDIVEALDWGFKEANIITLTGGLGPTHDDITKDVLCEYFGLELVLYPEILENLKQRFIKRGFKFSESNISQAEYPENTEIMSNSVGSAQGMHFRHEDKHLFVMPGVPAEMRAITNEHIIPFLLKKTGQNVASIDIHSIGIPESTLYESTKPILDEYEGIKVAYLPKMGMVSIRVSFTAGNDKYALIDDIYSRIRDLQPQNIFGRDEETLPGVVGELLKHKGASVATAESCTGGLIASLITDINGSSEYFETGFVTYANETKIAVLNVAETTMIEYGAVSKQTVSEMLAGTLEKTGSDYAVAVSGIAGPTGGSADKPVGTVIIGVADSQSQYIHRFQFGTIRVYNKKMSAFSALNLLRLFIQGKLP